MATVNYSVPEDIKAAFNEAFANQNKSAIIAGLMREAVADQERVQSRACAIDRLMELRSRTSSVTANQIRAVREEIRE